MSIIVCIAFMSVNSSKKFAADDQSLKILDILQEARQRAVNQRAVMRVEINNTKKQIRLFDENKTKAMDSSLANDTSDDALISSFTIDNNVTIGVHPSNVSTSIVPVQTSPIPELAFSTTTYSLSANDSVFTLCFLRDGRVVQTGTDNLCSTTNSLRGATIYVYSLPKSNGKSEVIRAVTVNGISASSGVYKCQLDSSSNCTTWVN